MNRISAFEPAIPAMVVGRSFDGSVPPLGLGEPFALRGGDRLGPDGLPFRIMHDHQPAFRRWIEQNCMACCAAERPWFKANPLLLTGFSGAGRTHAASWLALQLGVPHAVLNLSCPLIAGAVAASGRVSEAQWALPHTVAMAAARCANPIVTVEGADTASADVLAGLAAMIRPDTCFEWCEDQLEVSIDLSQVAWMVQSDRINALPASLRHNATAVALERPPLRFDSTFTLSVMLEAMSDLGIQPNDPAYGWSRLRQALPDYRVVSAKRLYSDIVGALRNIQHASAVGATENDAGAPF